MLEKSVKVIFIPRTKLRLAYRNGRKRKHSSTLYYMGRGHLRSGQLYLGERKKVNGLSTHFLITLRRSKHLDQRLKGWQRKAPYLALMKGNFMFVPHTQHLTRYSRVLVRL